MVPFTKSKIEQYRNSTNELVAALDKEHTGMSIWNVPATVSDETSPLPVALVPNTSQISSDGTLVLEEFSFRAKASTEVYDIADWIAKKAFPDTYEFWRDRLRKSLVILPDDEFRDFALYATEIITRIRIDRASKTVDAGALWTEEHLPTDTLLYVPVYATNGRRNGTTMQAKDILKKAVSLEETQGGYIQLGGDETVGRGLVRMHWEKE